ncbi:uncharacterized protein [Zea mays]|uniref:uncharacterized protein isoform X2 n=1 Tax=Zea mays TaxID=4577 RepID=UPI0004DEB234|nr:uncharacterized protein LOC100277376 isoform X2 [Zea mays]|eukprot:XP_023157089.1 uncharacterized protein LOC100277376 isoform X2 [Zea mays]
MDAEDERDLLKKIRALEEGQAELKRQVSKLQRRPDRDRRGGSSSSSQPADAATESSPSSRWGRSLTSSTSTGRSSTVGFFHPA